MKNEVTFWGPKGGLVFNRDTHTFSWITKPPAQTKMSPAQWAQYNKSMVLKQASEAVLFVDIASLCITLTTSVFLGALTWKWKEHSNFYYYIMYGMLAWDCLMLLMTIQLRRTICRTQARDRVLGNHQP